MLPLANVCSKIAKAIVPLSALSFALEIKVRRMSGTIFENCRFRDVQDWNEVAER